MKQNNSEILVSICCLTYNHEKFIRQALDSFLIQKTNFAFEIVIHDDASTDSTQHIIKEYIEKYPKVFNVLLQTKNQRSIYKNGMNPRFNYPRAKGKYIALCEGDDYWTDPLKLQKHVDFLEANEDYVLVADNAEWYDEINNIRFPFSTLKERDVTIYELLEKRQFATASVLFRNLPEIIQDPEKIAGDTKLWCYLTKFGKLRYKENVSSVYRRNAQGVVSGTEPLKWSLQMKDWNKVLQNNHPELDKNIFINRNYNQFFANVKYYFQKDNKKMFVLSGLELIKTKPKEGFMVVLNYVKHYIKCKLSQ